MQRLQEPCTVSGKRPSAASLQRGQEYMDWLAALQHPEGDTSLDYSWGSFMAQRRARLEKARLAKVAKRRWEQRQQKRQQKPLPTAQEYAARAERERARLAKVTEARRTKREAAGPAKKRGRPIDPSSARQRKLAGLDAKQPRPEKQLLPLTAAEILSWPP